MKISDVILFILLMIGKIPIMNTKINRIIESINEEHLRISHSHIHIFKYNLKKRTVKSILTEFDKQFLIDEAFIAMCQEYKNILHQHLAEIEANTNIRCRIKSDDSIESKLVHYVKRKNEDGNVPLNKCLNDFLGFRLIVSDMLDVYKNLIHDEKIIQIAKIYLRQDADYRAIHLYFKNSNNKFFPWELQVWDKLDEEKNELSHRHHKEKRKYINNPINYIKNPQNYN